LIELYCGINIGEELIIDPTRIRPAAAVSHAHSDHLRRHRTIYATAPTLDFSKISVGEFKGVPLEYGKTYKFGDCSVRPEPAGHILGSTQFVIDNDGYRIVYTGDLKMSPNETCELATIHECDILLIDTTFGKNIFNFPEYAYLKQRLAEFVESCLHGNCVPVIFAYNLGKAQEVMKILGDAGFSTYVTKEAYANAEIHEKHGINIKNYYRLDGQYPEKGAIIMPPSMKYLGNLDSRFSVRTCFVSGWALYPNQIRFGRADEYLPLSDHASYGDLIRYIEIADPDKIYCLFGFPDIVADLKYRGYDAVKATLANRNGEAKIYLKQGRLFD
jgi:putative mRNA 3-end processing factor